jgi:hypothetical protein
MRLSRRNINTRIEDPSTNLETVINVLYDHKREREGEEGKETETDGQRWTEREGAGDNHRIENVLRKHHECVFVRQ